MAWGAMVGAVGHRPPVLLALPKVQSSGCQFSIAYVQYCRCICQVGVMVMGHLAHHGFKPECAALVRQYYLCIVLVLACGTGEPNPAEGAMDWRSDGSS